MVKRCQKGEPALISVIFFISALPKQSEVPFVEKLERQENCPSIMLDKEGLDPHGIGNLLHILAIKNKLSPFRIRGKVESTHISDFIQTSSLFLVIF